MKKHIPVSVVIPTFNRKEYLKQCIDSILNQSVKVEIIVSDHGSTDGTPEMMKEYDGQLTYIRKEKDFGIHFCWLEGVLNASHEWIHINYDDDWIESDFIEKTFALVNDETGFIFSNVKMFNEENGSIQLATYCKNETGSYDSKNFQNLFSSDFAVSPGCTLLRKQIILNNLFCGEIPLSKFNYRGVGPDMLFTLMSLLKYPKVGFVNEHLAIFRAHDASITHESLQDQEKKQRILSAYDEAKKIYYLNLLNLDLRKVKKLLKFKRFI